MKIFPYYTAEILERKIVKDVLVVEARVYRSGWLDNFFNSVRVILEHDLYTPTGHVSVESPWLNNAKGYQPNLWRRRWVSLRTRQEVVEPICIALDKALENQKMQQRQTEFEEGLAVLREEFWKQAEKEEEEQEDKSMPIKTKKVEKEVEELEDITCNICGFTCKDKGNMNFEYALLQAHWGYCSNKDMQKEEAHICENCYDKHIFPLFKISPILGDFLDRVSDQVEEKKSEQLPDAIQPDKPWPRK